MLVPWMLWAHVKCRFQDWRIHPPRWQLSSSFRNCLSWRKQSPHSLCLSPETAIFPQLVPWGVWTPAFASNQESSRDHLSLSPLRPCDACADPSIFSGPLFIPSLLFQHIHFKKQKLWESNESTHENWSNNVFVHDKHSVTIRNLHSYY